MMYRGIISVYLVLFCLAALSQSQSSSSYDTADLSAVGSAAAINLSGDWGLQLNDETTSFYLHLYQPNTTGYSRTSGVGVPIYTIFGSGNIMINRTYEDGVTALGSLDGSYLSLDTVTFSGTKLYRIALDLSKSQPRGRCIRIDSSGKTASNVISIWKDPRNEIASELNNKTASDETALFKPPLDFAENSNVYQWMQKKGFDTEREMRLWTSKNYIQFWDEMATTYADWFEPWNQTLEWNPPYARWFVGAKCNIAYNAVDRHAMGAKKDKVAYIFVPEPTDQPTQKITYGQLYKEVNKFANGLKSIGVQKGDRVIIYLPQIPEAPIAMLACAKIGAVHCNVFSGFSAAGLNSRINDSGAKVVITSDGSYRRGKAMPLKPNVDEALWNIPSVQNVVVVKRTGIDISMKQGRDIYWHDLVANQPDECETEKMDSEDRLFILYTSGTTGKPEGIEHVHGGYQVAPAQTLHWVFDLKENDVWWCTTDVGWIAGHSYVVYGPLCLGATSILYEGSPDFPDLGRWFRIIQDNKVSVFYTEPTAIRMFMKAGEKWPQQYNLSSLRLLGSFGGSINPEAWIWYRKNFGGDKCQIMDTWWQTETGCIVISPLPMTPLKPGSPNLPLPGFNVNILDEKGNPVPAEIGGNLVINNPWPSMLRGLYEDPEKYKKEYWSTYWNISPGIYLTGDKVAKDKDGYFFTNQ